MDTLTTAGGLYIMVRAARQFLDAGYSLSEPAETLEQMRGKVKTLFSVGDMEPLRRSGRLGPVRQSVCTVLNVRPLLTCRDGAVMACGLVRGKSEQIRALAQAVPTGARGVVVQTGGHQAAQQGRNRRRKAHGRNARPRRRPG